MVKIARGEKLRLWRETAQEHGFMQKGAKFQPMPKKGTAAYKKIRKDYDKKVADLENKKN